MAYIIYHIEIMAKAVIDIRIIKALVILESIIGQIICYLENQHMIKVAAESIVGILI